MPRRINGFGVRGRPARTPEEVGRFELDRAGENTALTARDRPATASRPSVVTTQTRRYPGL